MNKVKMFSGVDYQSDYMAYMSLESKINKFSENNKIINISICCHHHEDKSSKYTYTAAVIYEEIK